MQDHMRDNPKTHYLAIERDNFLEETVKGLNPELAEFVRSLYREPIIKRNLSEEEYERAYESWRY